MNAIERLPDATAASIQASLLTVTVEDICCALFRYTIDHACAIFGASSGRTTFLVDYATWTVNVAHETDYSSIIASDKHQADDLERNSELRMLSYLGLLHITCTSANGSSACIWKEGRKIHSHLPATPPPSMSSGSSRSLTVSLRDMFSGMPVRRKYVASEALKRSQSDSLSRCVRELSLLNPHASVQLSVRHTPSSDGAAPTSKALVSLPRAPSLIHRAVEVFGADTVELRGMRDIAAQKRFDSTKMKVQGFVCSISSTNPCQIIFVQGRVWPGAQTRSAVHGSEREAAAFASMLARYGLTWSDDMTHMRMRGAALSPALYEKVSRRIAVSPGGSSSDRGAAAYAFVLVITLSEEEEPEHKSRRKGFNAATFEETLLDSICSETIPEASESRHKRKRMDRSNTANKIKDTTVSRPTTARLARESFGVGPDVPDGFIEWRDPMKGTLFHIDRRTGHSIAARGNGVDRKSFAEKADDEFDDPALDAALASIPSPSPATPVSTPRRKSRFFDSRRPDTTFKTTTRRVSEDGHDSAHRPAAGELELAITREVLQRVEVLDQVDDKFIVCSAKPSTAGSNAVLLCIDQHAADERYRLERMVEQFVSDCISDGAKYGVDRTITLGITRKEYDVLETNDRAKEEMEKLGWAVERAVMVHEGLGHAQVDLKGFPHILRDRVLADTGRLKDQELLIRVFKSCIEEVALGPHSVNRWDVGSGEVDWLALSRAVPTALMDVMKNKACRSAIMFNDALSREACQRVVRRLGQCRFPFMCAHGRPSLVPLCQVMTTHKTQ